MSIRLALRGLVRAFGARQPERRCSCFDPRRRAEGDAAMVLLWLNDPRLSDLRVDGRRAAHLITRETGLIFDIGEVSTWITWSDVARSVRRRESQRSLPLFPRPGPGAGISLGSARTDGSGGLW